jgi:hypothetical protein
VANQTPVTVPGGHLAVASAAEEVGVITRHLGVMAGLAGLFAVALQASLLIKGSHFAMRMRPLRTLVGLRFGLLMASLALLLGMAVQAHTLIDPLSFTAMSLLEVRTAVPFGRFLTADGGVTKRAVIGVSSGFANFREEGCMVTADAVGHQHAGGGLFVTLRAGFSIRRDSGVIEVELIHLLRFHHRHIHPGFGLKLLLTVGVTQGTGVIWFVDVDLVAGRTNLMIRHSGFSLGADRMTVGA